jgi:hypothetical protein
MGRILDLCGEVAAAAEPGDGGLVLPMEEQERLGQDWSEDEIEDALAIVQESLMQSELVEAADSLSARLVELLGAYGDEQAFERARQQGAPLDLESLGQLSRRIGRLEEILEAFRDAPPPDRAGFDALRRRLLDAGIEAEMTSGEEDELPEEDDGRRRQRGNGGDGYDDEDDEN